MIFLGIKLLKYRIRQCARNANARYANFPKPDPQIGGFGPVTNNPSISSSNSSPYVRQYNVRYSQNVRNILPLLPNEAVSIRSAGNSSSMIESVDNGDGTGRRFVGNGAVLDSEDVSSGDSESGALSE
jgi:hypothetical protein